MNIRTLGSSFLRAFLAERAITFATRVLTDVPMLVILAWDSSIVGIVVAFVVITPISFLLCVGIVLGSDVAYRRGIDMTGLETLRELESDILKEGQWVRRLIRKILKSRKLIFWIGSWFYLDPDYVTLLLRKKEEGYIRTFLYLSLPSVVIGMVVWLGVWWVAVRGFRSAVFVIDWIL
ncbi:MAG: hypothetical protein EXS69_01135 [Candidatus Zambryskibacteria bacterium]|nr:hypothetical protein [Candidatus Zambryskibacteria bacterium]